MGTATTASAVVATGLLKRYGGDTVVHDVDLDVATGEIHGILGPNGAGKSTTLRMTLGIVEPDGGERIVLGSRRPLEVSDRVGFLPEERSLYQNMKVREMLAFMGAIRGMPWSQARRTSVAMLEDIGLGDVAGSRVRTLSKGMAQFVQLVGAMVHTPDLLVLDEPFSGLDPINQERLERMVIEQRRRGGTVLFSTHVMGHAERLCDRVTIIAQGTVRHSGSVEATRALLPQRVRYIPKHQANDVARALPADAVADGLAWRFAVPFEGLEPLLVNLIDHGFGIADLTVESPSLHEAFMHVVGPTAKTGTTS